MKIAFVSTYPPSQCGIATFTSNLIKSFPVVQKKASVSSYARVVAIHDEEERLDYPEEVKATINKEDQADYVKAAKYINYSDCGLCVIEHEYGIFGGESGIYILSLIHRLQVPLIVTLHTVLKNPSFTQRSILKEIGARAQAVVVMSNTARELLRKVYYIPETKISVLEHGVPDIIDVVPTDIKNKFAQKNKKLLFTFGLLSRNKGIETVINALPSVIEGHPNLRYIILGNTHPNVLRQNGEAYRNYLNMLIREKGLEDHVILLKKFVTEEDLVEYLVGADIYIIPYLNEAQITSGTLSYAVGAGCAIVSTPFWHAKELLDEGRGRLFGFKDSIQLSSVLNDLLDDPEKLDQMKGKAFEYGRHLRWREIGKRYFKLSRDLIKDYEVTRIPSKSPLINLGILPTLQFDHLRRLTDDTGIVQHAKYGIPNLKEGYCLDDNSRALLTSVLAYRTTREKQVLDLMPVYFSYIHFMQNENGTFRNFLSFSRQYLDEEGSADAFGRTVWALGYLIRYAPNNSYLELAHEIFHRAINNLKDLKSPRGIANSLIGLSHYLQVDQSNENLIQLLEIKTKELLHLYDVTKSAGWDWFEKSLAYDNAVLPLALFHTLQIHENKKVMAVAEATTNFLTRITMKEGWLSPVGNDGWYEKGARRARFAQQATDVMAMVLLFHQAYLVTRKKRYIRKMFQSFTWYLGENDLRIPLYDHETKGCCDGLEFFGVNRNQGAESTLAYLISHMTVLNAATLEFEFEKRKNPLQRKTKTPKPVRKKSLA